MTCEIIKDLIPMYVDKTASVETSIAVKNHIKNCPECKSFYKGCKAFEEKPARNGFSAYEKDIPMIEESYVNFSKKLKKKKNIRIIIMICVFVAIATYVVIDIVNAVKRKERG